MNLYRQMFDRLGSSKPAEGAFVPFVMVGDPTPEASFAIIEALIAGGADALELGFPFSDPVADGPVIQESHLRALQYGIDVDTCLALVGRVRAAHPQIPIGLLVYANVPFARGLEEFYRQCAEAGVDSVLVPDVPVRESVRFSQAATAAGVESVYIAPPGATAQQLHTVAAAASGYVYAVSRAGVTGMDQQTRTDDLGRIVSELHAVASAPVLLGFGISHPKQVRAALQAGADGAISGSAIVNLVNAHAPAIQAGDEQALATLCTQVREFVSQMKAATR